MSSLRRLSTPVLGGVLSCLIAAAAHAGFVPYVGTQGPKADFLNPSPPPLNTAITSARDAFFNNVAALGGNEFEPAVFGGAGQLNFGYGTTGANATFSGGATIVSGLNSNFDPTLGRYNMTAGLPANGNTVDPGTWFEAQSSFTVSFSSAITAFSFFVTDLGDFDGTVFIDLFGSNSGNALFSQRLMNSAALPPPAGSTGQSANGNLLFFGITSSDPMQAFTSARFRIGQAGTDVDIVGFDSFVVGNYRGSTPPPTGIPEPGSLALAGLALLAAGYARKTRKAA